MESVRDTFERQQYVLMRSVVTGPLLGFLWRYVLERAQNGQLTPDKQVAGAPSWYADPVMEHLLERLRPTVEETTGLALYPTYSYLRLYQTGAVLERHQDRESCEISLTVNLGQDPSTPWPLWIGGASGAEAVDLHPGDALLYKGIEREHWRERYEGTRLAQVFLHYVNQQGPYAKWRFDKRDGLALTIPLPI